LITGHNNNELMEKLLKESEERFKSIFIQSPIGIALFDSEGNVIDINKSFFELFGVSKIDFIKVIDLFKDFNIPTTEFNKVKKGEIVRYETTHKFEKTREKNLYETTKSGEIYVDILITPQVDNKTKSVNQYIVQIQDISEVKKAELDLRELNQNLEKLIEQRTNKLKTSEKKYRHLFEKSPFAIVLVDSKGVILNCNQAVEKIFGFSKEDFIGKNFRDLTVIPDFEMPRILNNFKCLIKEKNPKPMIIQILNKERNLIWCRTDSTFLKFKNKLLVQIIVQDISDYVKSKQQLKEQNQKLQDLNNLKSEFFQRLSHDLKNPLVAIKGYTEMMLEACRNNINFNFEHRLKQILQSSFYIENIIYNLIESTKLDSINLELNLSTENVSEIIKKSVKDFRIMADLRDISLDLNIEKDLITKLDKAQIYDVISNLLSNAIKFTPKGGKVLIQAEVKENFIIISIKDNGVGFTKEEIKNIFIKFRKLDRSKEDLDILQEGSGLGLFLSKKIIELHGGKIWVESKGRNEGLIFFFSLPLIKD